MMTFSRGWARKGLVIGLPVGALGLILAGCPSSPPSTPTPTPTAPASTAPAASDIPLIPSQHKLWIQDSTGATRNDCLLCHSQAGVPFNYLGASASATGSFDMVPAPTSMAGKTANTCVGCHKVDTDTVPAAIGIVAAKTGGAAIDINNFGSETIWGSAAKATIPVFGVWNPANLDDPMEDVNDVTLQAAYDSSNLYIKAFVPDATDDHEKSPWIKQANGTWKKPAGFGDAFKQDDKLVFIWQVYIGSHTALTPDFSTKGCAVVCHDNQGAEGTRPNMYTNAAGQYLDAWRANLGNVLPLKVLMDCYLDPKGGVHSQAGVSTMDGKTVATVSVTASDGTVLGEAPKYEFPDQKDIQHEGTFFFTLGQTLAATNSAWANYVTGSRLPSIITQAVSGPVSQTSVNAKYGNGGWTYVFKRPLTTADATGDVQFNDLTKTYDFAIGVMSGTDVGHGIQRGINTLSFQQ